MRNLTFAQDEYYHLFNRGNLKQEIFRDDADRARFLFLILSFQSPKTKFYNVRRFTDTLKRFVQHSVLNKTVHTMHDEIISITQSRIIDLVCFALMPNHFHLLVREKEEGGISKYMQRVLNGYTKYWNTKYAQSGHLFQGPFQAVRVEDDHQLRYLSAYIHRNPHELTEWRGRAWEYPWSSYQDYAQDNRWGELLQLDTVRGQYNDGEDYHKFVETSGAKDERDADEELLIDGDRDESDRN